MNEPDELNAIAKELRAVVNGFKTEALNGVICTPLDDEHGTPQWDAIGTSPYAGTTEQRHGTRLWCARCRSRWSRLFLAADRLDRLAALLVVEGGARPQDTDEEKNQARVAPLKAGDDGQELPRRNERAK